jgi:hypothetical protein
MAKTKISVENFRDYYLKQNKPRSIRKLHEQLKQQFKNKSLPSLATIFRHSPQWKQMTIDVDNRSSAIAMDKIVEKKAVQLEEITDKLKQTSSLALESVLEAFRKGIASEITKPEQILSLVKASTESTKVANLLTGNPTSISSTFDNQDVASLKQHIADLYQSIDEDLKRQQHPTNLKLVKETKH